VPPELPVCAFVGLGANLGDAAGTVRAAYERLARLPGCGQAALSPLYRSAPVDADGPDFVNAVARLETAGTPEALLEQLQALEADFGRQRPFHHAPRTLDLDLLLHGDAVRHSPALTLPHPRLHLRAFVLAPLLDLSPELQVPGLGPLSVWLAAAGAQRVARWAP
jgi:2-amino-4-hydroxy-6-hydroxymethyldihydropteridine diphosphokinase